MIKSILKLVTVVVFFFSFTANAQDFITHKIKDTDSVKELATTYRVTTSQIYDLNPDAKKGLKPGAILIIPNVKTAVNNSVEIEKTFSSYTSHKVKRKETLFSISKLYNITTDELKKHNVSLYAKDLRKGDKIQIPVFTTKVTTPEIVETETPPTTTTTTTTEPITSTINDSTLQKGKYIVKKSEGKWRIAQNHNISVEELEVLNPNIKLGLKVGDTLNVPFKEIKNQVVEIKKTYKVLEAEGFFRIKLKTGLDQLALEALNPGLSETGLKPGMILNLGSEKTTNVGYTISNETGVVDLSKNLENASKKKLAILLPFKLSSIETDSVANTSKRLSTDKLLNISLDFYSGVEMALDSLSQLNIQLDVNVYDTNNRQSNAMSLADNLSTNGTQAVIGPLLPKNFNTFSSRTETAHLPVFSPLTKQVEVRSNVFQSRPSESLLYQRITNHVKKDSTANIVVLYDSKHKTEADKLKRTFPNATLLASKLDKDGKEQYFIYEVTVAKTLKNGNNIIFLQTEAEGFVSNVSSILNAKNNNPAMTITLATTNMNDAFEGDNVSNYQLSNLNFMFPTMARMYKKNANKGFVKNYKKKYFETPSSYAVRGFDLTMDVVLRLVTSENLLTSESNMLLTEYTENKFMYVKNSVGGFDNHAVYLVKYKDLNIVEIEN